MIVANIPHGLPSTVTACLLIVAERMQLQNVFVKNLSVIETLGCCSCICTDKTGTLTLNTMSVSDIWLLKGHYTASEFKEESNREIAVEEDTKLSHIGLSNSLFVEESAIAMLMQAVALNSDVTVVKKKSSLKSVETDNVPCGDPTEVGLHRYCMLGYVVNGDYYYYYYYLLVLLL